MTITTTEVTIDVNDDKTGNFLSMTSKANPDLEMTDALYGITFKDLPSDMYTRGGKCAPAGAICRKTSLISSIHNKKLVIVYNVFTGEYEISENDFLVTEVAKLKLDIHRYNPNSRADLAERQIADQEH